MSSKVPMTFILILPRCRLLILSHLCILPGVTKTINNNGQPITDANDYLFSRHYVVTITRITISREYHKSIATCNPIVVFTSERGSTTQCTDINDIYIPSILKKAAKLGYKIILSMI